MDLSAFPYLQGNYAPVEEERDIGEEQLTVEGVVPEKLVGFDSIDLCIPAGGIVHFLATLPCRPISALSSACAHTSSQGKGAVSSKISIAGCVQGFPLFNFRRYIFQGRVIANPPTELSIGCSTTSATTASLTHQCDSKSWNN